jgi:DNA-binding NarL/FixJ family response regulator
MDILQEDSFNLILLDMSMPGISGVDLISWIRTHDRHQSILVLSMHNEPQIAIRAIKAGASGYITKDSSPEKLIEAIRKVASGKRFIDPELVERMTFGQNETDQSLPHEQLSDREFQVLLFLILGKSIKAIADELSISNKTVSTHKARLMQKLNFRNNAELIRYGITHNLVI